MFNTKLFTTSCIMKKKQFLHLLSLWVGGVESRFSLVENSAFHKLIDFCNKNMHISSRLTISQNIKSIQDYLSLKMSEQFCKMPVTISITTDSLSTRVYKSYLSLKMHWLMKTGTWKELYSILWDFLHLIRFMLRIL